MVGNAFPEYVINLDLAPELRFVEPTTDLKEETIKMFNAYIHLVPRFIKNIFEENQGEL